MIVKNGIQKIVHPWGLKPEAAIALQTKLAPRVIRKSRIRPADIATVAGVDAGYCDDRAYAVVAGVEPGGPEGSGKSSGLKNGSVSLCSRDACISRRTGDSGSVGQIEITTGSFNA